MNFISIVFCFVVIIPASVDEWNFSGLQKDPYYEYKVSLYSYRFNFRKTLPKDNSHNCNYTNCIIEEIKSNDLNFCWCYGNLSSETVSIFANESGLNFSYTSMSPDYYITYGSIMLECADAFNYTVMTSGNNVTVQIYGKQGCKGWKPPPEKKKSHFGFGAIFLIILLVVIVLYFVIGIIILAAVLHKKGMDIFPLFPIIYFLKLVWDGVKAIISLIRGSSSYSNVGK